MTIVRPRHLRAAKLCARGSRAWFAKYGIDWNAFVTEGVDAEVLRGTGDPLAARAVEAAEMEAANGRG